ncbi:hypothetical protein [Bordetella flabilis]|uniref:DUF559 domain-containing protein n=1 Tax=Bordetella flabilis TaxID=463014 RepID=A0A193GBF4_9BORD|nr:hypothetical protein [Bordetella flabilis]ANN76791.1 hypothetical protein BAU07_06400 [Bordetella flabilis]
MTRRRNATAQKPAAKALPSPLEELLALQIRAAKFESPVREYRFMPGRRWRFDFAWPAEKLAVEIEGGVWNGGRHTRGAGFVKDTEKYNAAMLAGWRVLRFTGKDVKSGRVLKLLGELLQPRPYSPGYI